VRVCLDTNVLVAAFATRGLCADALRAVLVDHELVVGDVILEELELVLAEKLGVPKPRREAVRAALATDVVVPRPAAPRPAAPQPAAPQPAAPRPATPHTMPLADAGDAWIVATAIAGQADVLVTGDGGPAAAADAAPLAILSPRAFWERLRQVR